MKKASCFLLFFWFLLGIGACKKHEDEAPKSQVTADAGESVSVDISFNPGNCGQANKVIPLDGSKSSAAVGTIVYSQWTYEQGHPGNTGGDAQIISPYNLTTTVIITTPGSYWFKLKVYNDQNWIDDDEVNIQVTTDSSKGTKTQFLYPENLGTLEAIAPVAIVSANQKIIVQYYKNIGISNFEPSFDMFRVYDVFTKSWSDLHLTTDRRKVTMVSVGDKVVFSGGFSQTGPYTLVDVLDINSGSWTSFSMPGDFNITNSAVVGNRIFFTGYDVGASRYSDRLEILDISTKTWTRELMSQKRNSCTIIPAGDIVYFGDNPDYPPYTNVVDIFHLKDNSWSRGFIASGFAGARGAALGDKVYFYGGAIHESQNNRVAVWDPFTSKSEYLCLGGYFYSIYPYDDQLLFFRRFQDEWGYGLSEFEKFDPSTGKWTLGKIPNSDIQIGGVGTIVKLADKARIFGVSPVNYPDSKLDFPSLSTLPDYTFWDIEF